LALGASLGPYITHQQPPVFFLADIQGLGKVLANERFTVFSAWPRWDLLHLADTPSPDIAGQQGTGNTVILGCFSIKVIPLSKNTSVWSHVHVADTICIPWLLAHPFWEVIRTGNGKKLDGKGISLICRRIVISNLCVRRLYIARANHFSIPIGSSLYL
jgi:hypothetical protein